MFSGIVEEVGKVHSSMQGLNGGAFGVSAELFSHGDVKVGDSIAVSGVCLTVVRIDGHTAIFDLGTETCRCTTLGRKKVGEAVNLERSLVYGARLDGHLVSGHVDAVTSVLSREMCSNTATFELELAPFLAPLVVPKGSVAIDGVSLTVGGVTEKSFFVYIIPHTLSVTTFGDLKPGSIVNLEVDMLGRYVDRAVRYYLQDVGHDDATSI
ncbi:MAG: riboflavin synthase [Deltaproteobacteria bacterium]|nr:riboflavin synthase [Deltaproteobacteria bacterium]